MATPAHLLWRANNEYRRRLTQAQTLLGLLEQLLDARSEAAPIPALAALLYAQEQLDRLIQEHRVWRYTCYYESTDSKRMVQEERAIHQALARFSRMRAQHSHRLNDVVMRLRAAPRPDMALTRVPGGDLWGMVQDALNDLLAFDGYWAEAAQAP